MLKALGITLEDNNNTTIDINQTLRSIDSILLLLLLIIQ
jgi:hypothetical protein